MSKQLATIQQIKEIQPIEGKDRIVLAFMYRNSWQVICQKDQFKMGDLCVFIQPGALLPEDNEHFKFLESKHYKIRTMKMGGVRSEGILFPISILPSRYNGYHVGDDVTDILRIEDFTADKDDIEPVDKKGKKKYPKFLMRHEWFRKMVFGKRQDKTFPREMPRTDETRVQNIDGGILKHMTQACISEKVDGTSSSYILRRRYRDKWWKLWEKKVSYEYCVCSRNRRLYNKTDMPHIRRVSEKYDIENRLKDYINELENSNWVAIQGECIGKGVQGNPYKLEDNDLYIFNVYTEKGGRLSYEDGKNVADCILKMNFVPLLEVNKDVSYWTVNDFLKYADGLSTINPDVKREGVVIRSKDGRHSFKAVSPEYLISKGE